MYALRKPKHRDTVQVEVRLGQRIGGAYTTAQLSRATAGKFYYRMKGVQLEASRASFVLEVETPEDYEVVKGQLLKLGN